MKRALRVCVATAAAIILAATAVGMAVAQSGPALGGRSASESTAGAAGWKSATPGRPIVLPGDHVSHPDYKIEWWYYTGNLDAADGRRFGYQLTFFRVGVDPAPANPSRWTVRDLYMAHFAITDVDGRHYRFSERLNRSGPGWAGASTSGYRVWNENWEASLSGAAAGTPAGTRSSPHHLVATTAGFAIDLMLEEGRAPALHGDGGYSKKGAAAGNASHYYSLTRMPTTGTLTLDERAVAVTGSSWMDHEFGTSFLEPGQVGWDWFSVQLDDGRDLMIFQMRRDDGSIDPHSSGTLIEPGGRVTKISYEDGFRLEPVRTWTSRMSGARYPVAWRVRIPSAGLELTVDAALDEQELHTEQSSGISYWEGAIDVGGTAEGRAIRGRGYLEMTGYVGTPMGDLLR